jgi:membrane protein
MRLKTISRVLRAAWVEYERDRGRYLAAAMVYYALISLVPLLLLLLAALGLLLRFSEQIADTERQVLAGIEARFGTDLKDTIERFMETLQDESIGATVVSLIGLLLTASVLFRHLRISFRAIWKIDPPLIAPRVRSVVFATLLERVISFLMVLGGGALLLAALVLMAVSQWVNRTFGNLPVLGPTAEWMLPVLTSFTLVALTFAALFKLLPPVRLRWADVWPAVLLCTVGWIIAGEALTRYGAYFGSSPSTSGALGAILAFMLWMNVVSQLLFFGAEVCKVVANRRAELAAPSAVDDAVVLR